MESLDRLKRKSSSPLVAFTPKRPCSRSPTPEHDSESDSADEATRQLDSGRKPPQFRNLTAPEREAIRQRATMFLVGHWPVNKVSALIHKDFRCQVSQRTLYNWKSEALCEGARKDQLSSSEAKELYREATAWAGKEEATAWAGKEEAVTEQAREQAREPERAAQEAEIVEEVDTKAKAEAKVDEDENEAVVEKLLATWEPSALSVQTMKLSLLCSVALVDSSTSSYPEAAAMPQAPHFVSAF